MYHGSLLFQRPDCRPLRATKRRHSRRATPRDARAQHKASDHVMEDAPLFVAAPEADAGDESDSDSNHSSSPDREPGMIGAVRQHASKSLLSQSFKSWNDTIEMADSCSLSLEKILLVPNVSDGRLCDGSLLVSCSLGYDNPPGHLDDLVREMRSELGLQLMRCSYPEATDEELQETITSNLARMKAKVGTRSTQALPERPSPHSSLLSRFALPPSTAEPSSAPLAAASSSTAESSSAASSTSATAALAISTATGASSPPPSSDAELWVLQARCEARSDPIESSRFFSSVASPYSLSHASGTVALSGGCGRASHKAFEPWAAVLVAGHDNIRTPSTLCEIAASELHKQAASTGTDLFIDPAFTDACPAAERALLRQAPRPKFHRARLLDSSLGSSCRSVCVEPTGLGQEAAPVAQDSVMGTARESAVWLAESCGGRIKCFGHRQGGEDGNDDDDDRQGGEDGNDDDDDARSGGRSSCLYTLDNGSGANALVRVECQGKQLLVASTRGDGLNWWDVARLDPSTGGSRIYSHHTTGEGRGREHHYTLERDAFARRHPSAPTLSAEQAQNICHVEDLSEVDVTCGEAAHGQFSLGMPHLSPPTGSDHRRKAAKTGDKAPPMDADKLCYLAHTPNPLLAVACDGRGPDGNGVRSSEVLCLLDLATGRSVGHLFGHCPNAPGYITCTRALAAGGCEALAHTLASAGSDDTIKVWDTRTRRPTHTLVGQERADATALAFAPEGGAPLLFSGASDGAIRLWDLRSDRPRCVYELATGNACVEELAWDSERHTLVALTRRREASRGGRAFAFGGGGGCSSDDEEAEPWDAWPRDAHHPADDFGVQWNQPGGTCALSQYRFLPQPQQPRRYYGPTEERAAVWRYISEAYGRSIGVGF